MMPLAEGMNIDPHAQVQVANVKIADDAVRMVMMEAAIQQLLAEKQQLTQSFVEVSTRLAEMTDDVVPFANEGEPDHAEPVPPE